MTLIQQYQVSTHSRPKAAGAATSGDDFYLDVSTHSRPKAAGSSPVFIKTGSKSFQHTAARRRLGQIYITVSRERGFQHTAARRRLERLHLQTNRSPKFQHTAARRRLDNCGNKIRFIKWFQHTAARRRLGDCKGACHSLLSFNTQPPEGGWEKLETREQANNVSTHSRPKAAGKTFHRFQYRAMRFNTQPPEGGWRRRRR